MQYENYQNAGRLSLSILAQLLNHDGPVSGYDVMQSLTAPSGSVYPALQRLVEEGIFEEVSAPEGFSRKGGAYARHFDYTSSGLFVAAELLQPVQVPGLHTVVRLKSMGTNDQTPE